MGPLLANPLTASTARFGRTHQRGQGLVEWGLAVVLIAIVLILIITVLGNTVNNDFSNVSNGLNGQ